MAHAQKIDLVDFIPLELRNEKNTSLFSNIFNKFLSEEKSVAINGQIGQIIEPIDPIIPSANLDRDLNALIPAISFKTGTEETVLTFDDLKNKLESLGVNTQKLKSILAEQSLNFAPPINFDKFINYSNYFWDSTGSAIWNPDMVPEYYVIEKPKLTDIVKMPVSYVVDRDVKLWGKDRPREKITISFSSNTNFFITGEHGGLLSRTTSTIGAENQLTKTLVDTAPGTITTVYILAPDLSNPLSYGYGVGDANLNSDELFSFTITSGEVEFSAGDSFQIDIEYITGSSLISFSGTTSVGKGFISNISADNRLMSIDGAFLVEGKTILVCNQNNPAENGIYIVSAGKWERAPLFNKKEYLPNGSIIFASSRGLTYELSREDDSTFVMDDVSHGALKFNLISSIRPSLVNDWQQYNFWVHKDDISGSSESLIQATRPIIEYSSTLQLNEYVDLSNYPASSGTNIHQTKHKLNQIPQFDLFYFDGTHAKKTSGIFFYTEDPDYPIDVVLQRRLKTTVNYDYIFGHGIEDEQHRLLFFKENGVLKTIWEAGVTSPETSTINFIGLNESTKGTLTVSELSASADNQSWTIKATSPNKFAVIGSRSGNIGLIDVDSTASFNDFTLAINSGTTPFAKQDTFTFSVRNISTPRFVKKAGKEVINADPETEDGTWLIPRRMFENLERQLVPEINYGDCIDHFRSIIKAQNNFVGSSFGVNNFRNLSVHRGYGGIIREYNGNFPLLVSLLAQKDLSPLSIIDYAEQAYVTALASINQFIIDELPVFMANNVAVSPSTINTLDPGIVALLAEFEQSRAQDIHLQEVFGDSTAAVKNWPVSLAIIGLVDAIAPTIVFDDVLGIDVIVHHDGHKSPIMSSDHDFNKHLVNTSTTRVDGSFTPGVYAEIAPLRPYARQLWMKPSTGELFVFNVSYDSDDIPTGGKIGEFWYRRFSNSLHQLAELREWNETNNTWVLSAASLNSRWVPVDTSIIQNSLFLAVEEKLYSGINPEMSGKMNVTLHEDQKEYELAKFAAKYGFDTYASDFNAADAFTWNYSQAVISDVTVGISRWFNIYFDYFNRDGCLPTARPNLEPWKLLGAAVKPVGWDELYAGTDRLWTTAMWTHIQTQRPGLKICVNPLTDELLPPYVSAVSQNASYALTNVIPASPDARYKFGDEGPVEAVWRRSAEYLYGCARINFKVDPLNFLDLTWGEIYSSSGTSQIKVEHNLMRPLSPSKFLLHGEKLNIINERNAEEHFAVDQTTGSISSLNEAIVKFDTVYIENNKTVFYVYVNGVLRGSAQEGEPFSLYADGVNFTNITLNDLGIPFSLGDSFTIEFKNTGRVLSFCPSQTKKLIGFGQLFTNLLRYNSIDTEKSDAINAYRGWSTRLVHRLGALVRDDTLSVQTTVGTLSKTSFSIYLKKSEHVTGKWISAIRIQLIKVGTSVASPWGTAVPSTDGSDWIFRIETYNPQHPIVEFYPPNTSGQFTTFNVLRKERTSLSWKRFLEKLALTKTTTPFNIVGIQNTINFLFGYVARLEELGFKINFAEEVITDKESGRNLDWQLEIEKFIDKAYYDFKVNEAFIINPFMRALWLDTPVGLMSNFVERKFVDINSAQAVFDVTGSVIPVTNLDVVRTDDYAVTYSDIPIFSGHLFVDEYEHIIVFNKGGSSDNLVVFDPFLGLRITSAHLAYTRQEKTNRKPYFPGFVLSKNGLKRNIVSSIDAIGNYYDVAKTFDEPDTVNHALALVGFNKKDYFSNLRSSGATQFNFWRGLVQAKGTNMTVDAFVNYKKYNGASIDEYWAYKVAEYGDARPRNFPEVKIEVRDCLQKFTQLQFFNKNFTHTALPLFTQIESTDDSRWFNIDDLNVDLSFRAQPITAVISALDVGFYSLPHIFHNGDTEPVVYLKTTVDGVVLPLTHADTARVVNANLLEITSPLVPQPLTQYEYIVEGFTWVNPSKVSPIKLFNYVEKEMIKEIGLWHPAIGIHAADPLSIIHSITAVDPALYNTTGKITNNPNYGLLKPWGKKEVGRVWWDTSKLGYIPYYDAKVFPDRNERHARWGNPAEWASIDLYEWIESDVPPSEYDTLALEQEGQLDVDPAIRASGKAALKKFYARDRIIKMRSVAWSHAGANSADAHPAFGPAYTTKTLVSGGAIYADSGRTADIGLTTGRRFGAWKLNIPHGELSIDDEKVYDIGSSNSLSLQQLIPTGNISNVEVRAIPRGRIGQYIGAITISSRLVQINSSDYVQKLRMANAFGDYEDVEVETWRAESENDIVIQFSEFGIEIKITRINSEIPYLDTQIVTDLEFTWGDVYIREGIRATQFLPLPDTIFVNDVDDIESSVHEYGWKTWDVPTQTDLDSDLVAPRNSWQPYIGELVEIPVTPTIVADINHDGLTLRNGIIIRKFASTWTDWEVLVDVRIEKISNGIDILSFSRAEFLSDDDIVDANRISIYGNGMQISPQNFKISGDSGSEIIEFVNMLPEGTSVLFMYRAYVPTTEELEFNSEIEDDPSIQTEYKADYQYTKIDTRNETGAFVGSKYYFWVEDSTIVRPNKSMSLVHAKNILTHGPSQFAIFAQLVEEKSAYDSIVIAGLNTFVTNNDTYKLRFANIETLRDDPEQLKLKNVHAEWALMRRSQSFKIPVTLWEKLTDAVAGEDIGGNPLPSRVRIDYDERNKTKTRFGFKVGQILVDTILARETIKNTILNTSLKIRIGSESVPDYISALNFDEADSWFENAAAARATMNLIWTTARPKQINEIFFEILEDALANNYEFSDIFKTSLISVYTSSAVTEKTEEEIQDGLF